MEPTDFLLPSQQLPKAKRNPALDLIVSLPLPHGYSQDSAGERLPVKVKLRDRGKSQKTGEGLWRRLLCQGGPAWPCPPQAMAWPLHVQGTKHHLHEEGNLLQGTEIWGPLVPDYKGRGRWLATGAAQTSCWSSEPFYLWVCLVGLHSHTFCLIVARCRHICPDAGQGRKKTQSKTEERRKEPFQFWAGGILQTLCERDTPLLSSHWSALCHMALILSSHLSALCHMVLLRTSYWSVLCYQDHLNNSRNHHCTSAPTSHLSELDHVWAEFPHCPKWSQAWQGCRKVFGELLLVGMNPLLQLRMVTDLGLRTSTWLRLQS